jgi:hypothetical protein
VKPGESAPGERQGTGRRPSPESIEKRAARADRQAAFAATAGWVDVAELYQGLAAALRALVA